MEESNQQIPDKIAEVLKLRAQARKEGFWYSTYEPELPMPVANVLTEQEAKEIYDLIVEKQKDSYQMMYRGLSHSRITNETLGCMEFETKDYSWRWPGDFAEHYILKYRVKPSDDFLKFLNYETI